jgi:hypothetical protein
MRKVVPRGGTPIFINFNDLACGGTFGCSVVLLCLLPHLSHLNCKRIGDGQFLDVRIHSDSEVCGNGPSGQSRCAIITHDDAQDSLTDIKIIEATR